MKKLETETFQQIKLDLHISLKKPNEKLIRLI